MSYWYRPLFFIPSVFQERSQHRSVKKSIWLAIANAPCNFSRTASNNRFVSLYLIRYFCCYRKQLFKKIWRAQVLFDGATNTPVQDFWWRLPWVSKTTNVTKVLWHNAYSSFRPLIQGDKVFCKFKRKQKRILLRERRRHTDHGVFKYYLVGTAGGGGVPEVGYPPVGVPLSQVWQAEPEVAYHSVEVLPSQVSMGGTRGRVPPTWSDGGTWGGVPPWQDTPVGQVWWGVLKVGYPHLDLAGVPPPHLSPG